VDTVTLTRIRTLAAIAVVAAVLTWVGMGGWERWQAELPGVPRTAPVALALLAAIMLAMALSLRARLRQRRAAVAALEGRNGDPGLRPGRPAARPRRPLPKPVNPFFAARAVALAKASSHVGSAVLGFYAGFGLFLLAGLEAPAYRERAILCGLAALASLALVAVAVWLERICRLPTDDDEPTVGAPAA
jgi:Protein of unknown function (DUF3180)